MNGHAPTTDPAQEAQAARLAIDDLLVGNGPNGADPATMGVYGEVYRELHVAWSQGGTEAARAAFAACVNADPALAALVAGDDEDEPEAASPLDAQPHHDFKLGWVDDYAELMSRLTGSPAEFNRLTGLVLAATVIQRRARLRMSFADIYPNIYGTILAPSSVYHKSSALGKVRQVIQRAGLDKLLLSELMTSEGLLGQLQGKPSGVVIRDEIGTLFDSHQTKYLRNLKPDLTALYDCYPYSRRLSAIEIKVEQPYLNIIGATTPDRFFDGVAAIDWRDGFLARWLFVLPEAEPDWDAMAGLYTTEHDAAVGAIATPLVNLDRQHDTDFALVGDAFVRWDAWQRAAAKTAFYYGDDTTAAIVTRYAAYALKFGLILAAVNGSWGSIDTATMQTAIDLAEYYKGIAGRLLQMRKTHGVSGAKLQKVFRIIKDGKELGVNRKRLLQGSHLLKDELDPVLEKLTEVGAVTVDDNGRGTRYMAAADALPVKSWK